MKTIADILHQNSTPLTKLIHKIKATRQLEGIFRAVLDPKLTKHCRFATYNNSELTITVANTAWATRLHYAIPDIIKQLQVQPEFKKLTNIRYTITAPKIAAAPSTIPRSKISQHNELLWQKTLAELKRRNQRGSK